MGVYAASGVLEVRDLYGSSLDMLYSGITTRDFSDILVNLLYEGYKNKHPGAAVELSNNFPSMAGQNPEAIFNASLGKNEMQAAIDNVIGKGDPTTIIDPDFEEVVDMLLAGDKEKLRDLLDRSPALISQHSPFRHGATLLHYASSNGVEIWRQVVPSNLPEIVDMLLARGADRLATMHVYGGNFDVLSLASSSAHPVDANVHDDLLRSLGE